MQKYRQRRQLADHDVWVFRDDDRWRARIGNVTEVGLRLIGDLPLQTDDDITIEGESWSVSGSVRWVKDGRVGVRIAKPLPPSVLSRLTGRAMRLNRPSRVGFHQHL